MCNVWSSRDIRASKERRLIGFFDHATWAKSDEVALRAKAKEAA